MENLIPKNWAVADKVAAGVIVGVVFMLIKTMMGISSDLHLMRDQMEDVAHVSNLRERLSGLEANMEDGFLAQNLAFIQLSSSISQKAAEVPVPIEMEMRDSVHHVQFDPRLSPTDVTVEISGAYFMLAAAQMEYALEQGDCLDLFLRIAGNDMANSNVRLCLAKGMTNALVTQAIVCLAEGDIVNVMMQGNGIQAMHPEGAPLVPSIIFSMFRIGQC